MSTALNQLTLLTRRAATLVGEMLVSNSQQWEMPYLYAQRWVLIQNIVGSIHGDHPANIILGHVRYLLWEFAQVLERAPRREGIPDRQDCQTSGLEARSDATFGPAWAHNLTQHGAHPMGAIPNNHGEGWIYVPATPGLPRTSSTSTHSSRTFGRPQRIDEDLPSWGARPRQGPYPAGPAPPRPRYGQASNIGPLPREGPRIVPAGFTRCLANAHRCIIEHVGTLAPHCPEWARWHTLAQIAKVLSISNGEVEDMVYTIQQALWGHTYLVEHILSVRSYQENTSSV